MSVLSIYMLVFECYDFIFFHLQIEIKILFKDSMNWEIYATIYNNYTHVPKYSALSILKHLTEI